MIRSLRPYELTFSLPPDGEVGEATSRMRRRGRRVYAIRYPVPNPKRFPVGRHPFDVSAPYNNNITTNEKDEKIFKKSEKRY